MKAFTYGIGVVGALAVTLYPLTLSAEMMPTAFLAGLAFVGFLLALVSNEWVLAGPGAAVLFVEYAAALDNGDVAVDAVAPLVGVGALIVLETIDLITLIARRPSPPRAVIVGHVRHALIVVFAGTAVAAAVVLAAQVVGGGPSGLAGVAAASGLLAIVIAVVLAHRAVEGA